MSTLSRSDRRHLDGLVVVVTGSSRGIGRETAGLLLDAGARVVLNGRSPDSLEATRTALAARSPDRVTAIAADVSTGPGAEDLVAHALARWGRVDALINNAGISMRGPAAELRPETLDLLVAGNLRSALLPTIAALPELSRCRGRILTVSTVAALHGFPGVSLYSATKAAVEVFFQSLSAELHGSGVSVGMVFLGFVENDPDKTTLGADGTAFHHERAANQSQAQAATAICRALARRRRRTITIPAGRALSLALRVAPRLVAAVLARSAGSFHRVDRG